MTMNSNTVSGMIDIHPSCDCPDVFISLALRDRTFALVDEVAGAGRVEQLRGQVARFAEVLGKREALVDQIARMASARNDVARRIVLRQEPLDQRRVEPQ